MRKKEGLEDPVINLTPLIDVVFVILIMFIVVAPLLELDRVELAEGGAQSLAVKESGPVAIHVQKDNSIFFNQKKINLEELTSLLAEAYKKQPEAHPQLFQDRQAHFGTYQSIKNCIEATGFESFDVVLKPT